MTIKHCKFQHSIIKLKCFNKKTRVTPAQNGVSLYPPLFLIIDKKITSLRMPIGRAGLSHNICSIHFFYEHYYVRQGIIETCPMLQSCLIDVRAFFQIYHSCQFFYFYNYKLHLLEVISTQTEIILTQV